jgi:hypothetical protein
MKYFVGFHIKLADTGGCYPNYKNFFSLSLSPFDLKKFASSFHSGKLVPIDTPLEVVAYGLHENADEVVYALRDIHEPNNIYLCMLQDKSHSVTLIIRH